MSIDAIFVSMLLQLSRTLYTVVSLNCRRIHVRSHPQPRSKPARTSTPSSSRHAPIRYRRIQCFKNAVQRPTKQRVYIKRYTIPTQLIKVPGLLIPRVPLLLLLLLLRRIPTPSSLIHRRCIPYRPSILRPRLHIFRRRRPFGHRVVVWELLQSLWLRCQRRRWGSGVGRVCVGWVCGCGACGFFVCCVGVLCGYVAVCGLSGLFI